jgi:hypothetical protein
MSARRSRTLLWASWFDREVTVDGRQHADGTVEINVSAWVGDGE